MLTLINLELQYRRSTIFHCHLIFVGIGGKVKMKIYNTINTEQWYRNEFSGPKLENKN